MEAAGQHRVLLWICLIALAARIAVAVAFPSVVHPDETLQYLEQANRIVTGRGLVPWEYLVGARSWVLPYLLAPVFWIAHWVSPSPALALQAVAFVSSAASLAIVVSAYALGWRAGGRTAAIAAALLTALWPEIVLMSSHVLADTVSAVPLAVALAVGYRRPARAGVLLATGALLAFAAMLRPQLLPAVAAAGFWIGGREWRHYLPLAGGGLAVAAVFGLVDWWTWGLPFVSAIRNYVANRAGIASTFGTAPADGYVLVESRIWFWATLPIAVTALAGARRLPLVAVVAAVVVATFSLVGHKEERFIYPAIPLLFILCGVGTAELGRLWQAHREAGPLFVPLCLAVLWCSAASVSAATPAFRERLQSGAGTLSALAAINADPRICGLAIGPADEWWRTGTVRLRPDIGLYSTASSSEGYNAILVFDDSDYSRLGFRKSGCFTGGRETCVFRRAGACRPGVPLKAEPSPEVAAVLRRLGLEPEPTVALEN